MGKNSNLPAVLDLAAKFAEELESEIGAANLEKVTEANAARTTGMCASQDYCDANEIMAYAFAELAGRSIDMASDKEVSLFNDAWGIAKDCEFSTEAIRNYFTR